MPSATYVRVREALIKRHTIIGTYDGLRRELCPHAIGSTRDVERALFYQCAGHTSKGAVVPGSPANWRCMDLERLAIIEVRESEWESIPTHGRRSRCIEVVDLAIDRQ